MAIQSGRSWIQLMAADGGVVIQKLWSTPKLIGDRRTEGLSRGSTCLGRWDGEQRGVF